MLLKGKVSDPMTSQFSRDFRESVKGMTKTYLGSTSDNEGRIPASAKFWFNDSYDFANRWILKCAALLKAAVSLYTPHAVSKSTSD